jgi:tRNA(Ile)-lysidine synthase
MARIDMSALACVRQDALNLEPLRKLSAERQRNVLRYWLQTQGLPVPNYAVTQELVVQVLTAAEDSSPLVAWQGAEVRRYGPRLYAMAPMTAHDARQRLCWDLRAPLDIPGVVSIQVLKTRGRGLSVERLAGRSVQIRFRQGGETCRLVGRQQTFTLKNLLQQWRVLPWMRARIPLLYVGEELAAVGDFAYCREFAAAADEMGWTLHCEYSQAPTE